MLSHVKAFSHPSECGSVSVIAPKEAEAGKIEIPIDGQMRATAGLSATGDRQVRQTVYEIAGLPSDEHAKSIVNRGPGPVAVDALIIGQ